MQGPEAAGDRQIGLLAEVVAATNEWRTRLWLRTVKVTGEGL
jgi:hypothetical protein